MLSTHPSGASGVTWCVSPHKVQSSHSSELDPLSDSCPRYKSVITAIGRTNNCPTSKMIICFDLHSSICSICKSNSIVCAMRNRSITPVMHIASLRRKQSKIPHFLSTKNLISAPPEMAKSILAQADIHFSQNQMLISAWIKVIPCKGNFYNIIVYNF